MQWIQEDCKAIEALMRMYAQLKWYALAELQSRGTTPQGAAVFISVINTSDDMTSYLKETAHAIIDDEAKRLGLSLVEDD